MQIGRTATAAAGHISRRFRTGSGVALRRQRAAAASALVSAGALGVVSCYQLGLIPHLPDPPARLFDSDRVDASAEAYVLGHAPDGPIGVANAAATAALVVLGGAGADRPKMLRVLTAAKAVVDAVGGLWLFAEQLQKHRKPCSWCTVATLAHLATVPLTLPEALRR